MAVFIEKEKVKRSINIPEELKESPCEILEKDFKSIGGLPIKGGWGYTREEAVILIDKHPLHIDYLEIQKIFVQKRTLEELIIFRPEGQKFNGIEWVKLSQALIDYDGRKFDHLEYEISGFMDEDWVFLENDYRIHDSFKNDIAGKTKHLEAREERIVKFHTDFWFDISKFWPPKKIFSRQT